MPRFRESRSVRKGMSIKIPLLGLEAGCHPAHVGGNEESVFTALESRDQLEHFAYANPCFQRFTSPRKGIS
jgi:hypothetical protein